MKKALFTALFCFSLLHIYGQINMNDSTVQVVGYWDKNEKQSYLISHEKIQLKETDTISREIYTYNVDITIADSTENSYTINWFYHDYKIDSDNEIMKMLNSITEDMTISIKTDGLGVFQEVINWEEIRDYISKGLALLKVELKDKMKDIPNFDKIIGQTETLFSTKEAIENSAINEIMQFYYFHGLLYKLGEEYNYSSPIANIYGGEPLNTDITLWLDDIDADNNSYIMRTYQMVDSKQLTKVSYDYICQLAETLGGTAPAWDKMPPLSNETRSASSIHGSGWILYSVQTKEVTAENQTTIEETIIELQ